jgi:hypothetical protein
MKKAKAEEEYREKEGDDVLDKMVRKELTCEQRPERRKGLSHDGMCRGRNKSKGSKGKMSLVV